MDNPARDDPSRGDPTRHDRGRRDRGCGYDAIVLAGGAARRMGGADKPSLTVGGVPLLDRVLAGLSDAGRIVVVGPSRPTRAPVLFCREQPPGSGPVAALAAGLAETGAQQVLVLAADLPWVAPAVPRLLAAVPDRGAALLREPDGHLNFLAAAWHRPGLVAALGAVGDPAGVSMRRLTSLVQVAPVTDQQGWARDCDTWEELRDARAQAHGERL